MSSTDMAARYRHQVARASLIATLATGLGGCASAPNVDATDEPTDQVENALTSPTWAFDDWSNTVHVKVWQCDWSALLSNPHASCTIPDPNYVLVGGGAAIQNLDQPGAFLTATYPSADLTTWNADSKDHLQSFPHQLAAHVIGLKLDGVSAASLRSQMSLVQADSPTAQHPSTLVNVPSNHVVVGGGARANYTGAGQLLIESDGFGALGGGWAAGSKDHGTYDPGTVTAFAIGIPECPTGYVGGCLQSVNAGPDVPCPSGYCSMPWGELPAGFALTCPGGWTGSGYTFAKPGRMIVQLGVLSSSVGFTTKDHFWVDTATAMPRTTGLAKR